MLFYKVFISQYTSFIVRNIHAMQMSFWICTIVLLLLGCIGFVEKVCKIDWSRKVWMSLLAVFIIATALQVLIANTDANASARRSEDQTAKVQAMERDSAVMAEQLAKQRAELDVANSQVENIRRFTEVAKLNASGSLTRGGDISFESDLTRLLQPIVTIDENTIRVRKDSEAEAIYKNVVAKFPDFPFGHYYLAISLRERAAIDWTAHAETAMALFQETTRVVGHNSEHDDGLRRVKKLLEKPE